MDKGWKIITSLAIPFVLVVILILANLGSQQEITPNDDFFVVSIGSSPYINASEWVLEIDGLVENPLRFSYYNITSFPKVSEIETLKCVDGPTGTANWTGVRLKAILDMAKPNENATEVVFYGADGYSSSLTIEDASESDVILAYEMNEEPLPVDQGYPLRLVAPDKYGYKWVKWITHIEFINYDYKGFWESRGWDDNADITPISEWWIHSILLTIAAYFGTLSVLSGFKFSKEVEFGKNLPKLFSVRFHITTSLIYALVLLPVSFIWIFNSYNKRGTFPNTNHGYLALAVTVLAVIGLISGYVLSKNKKNENLKTLHLASTFLGFLLLLGTILTGLIIGGVIGFY